MDIVTGKRAILVAGSSRFLFVENLLDLSIFSESLVFADSFYASLLESRSALKAYDRYGLNSNCILQSCEKQRVTEIVCLISPDVFNRCKAQLAEIQAKGIELTALLVSPSLHDLPSVASIFTRFIVLDQLDKKLVEAVVVSEKILVLSHFARFKSAFLSKEELVRTDIEFGSFLSQLVVGSQRVSSEKAIRVLVNVRENVFTTRGGDTVVIECLKEQLAAHGVEITVDEKGEVDPSGFDLVHLFNFATPEITESFAKRAVQAGTPFVVTALNEDRPRYFNQMFSLFSVIEIYIKEGQVREIWPQYERVCSITKPGPIWDNKWTAANAELLIATGKVEAEALRRDYPSAKRIEIVGLGADTLSDKIATPDLFRKESGLSDFVLCVGRLERRKNQLMLLKALEDTDHTIVFATSGMTYEPEYVEAVKNFKRKGRTVFFPMLDKEMLASAFAAARVHALPSWYELPGLVHLEAAQQGTPCVVTDFGTTRDYLGDDAFYCRPDNAASVKNAVEEAWDVAKNNPARVQRLQERALSWRWEDTGKKVAELYRQVLSKDEIVRKIEPAYIAPSIERASDTAYQASRSVSILPKAVCSRETISDETLQRAEELCLAGEKMVIAGDRQGATEQYQEALGLVANHSKALRGLGVVALTQNEFDEAQGFFEAARENNRADAKAISGIGACLWAKGDRERGYQAYIEAVMAEPLNVSAIFHLLNASYELKRFSDLENSLRRYLVECSEDVEMRYCLAGCYVAQEKYSLAQATVERILQLEPEHEQAVELRDEIKRRISEAHSGLETSGAGEVRILIERIEDAKAKRDYEEVLVQVELAEKIIGISNQSLERLQVIKGESLACLERFDEAVSCFVISLESAVYGDRAHAGLGVVAAARGRWAEARSNFAEALRRNQNNDTALAGLAVCDASEGEKEKAWENYQKALGVNNENKRALLGLVELGYQLNRLPVVERALTDYLEMHPLDLSMLYTAAGCCYAQGKMQEALEKLNTIILVDQQHEYANELRDKIVGGLS